MSRPPLSGIRVLDLTSIVVGPVATQFLGDYGADVVKIEAPSGDLLRQLGGQSKSGSLSPKFMNLNRNKRSLAIDMKAPGARPVMEKLLATSDVVVTNMRPNALKRLGLDYESARKLRPDVIYCHVVGFGTKGRYAGKPAYDTIIQGMSGVAATNYRAHGEPRYLPMVMADHIVGFVVIQFVLMALLHRHQTGEGQYVEIPMFENMTSFVLAEHMGQLVHVGSDGPSGDLRVLDPLAQPTKTKDSYICVSANSDKQAFALFDAIGRPELKDDPRFCSVKARFRNVSEYHRVRNAGPAAEDDGGMGRDLRQARRPGDAVQHLRGPDRRPAHRRCRPDQRGRPSVRRPHPQHPPADQDDRRLGRDGAAGARRRPGHDGDPARPRLRARCDIGDGRLRRRGPGAAAEGGRRGLSAARSGPSGRALHHLRNFVPAR